MGVYASQEETYLLEILMMKLVAFTSCRVMDVLIFIFIQVSN